MMSKFRKRALLSLVSGLAFIGVNAYASSVTWKDCGADIGVDSSYDCSTFYVPLDYQSNENYFNDSGYIGLELIRYKARDQENKKGTIFLNPGGPGGSGFDFVRYAAPFLFTEEVREQFDLVGFDPRGIGRSAQLRCFDEIEELLPLFSLPSFPTNDEEIYERQIVEQGVSDLCLLRASDIIDHMSTADVARDLDSMRYAVGDEKLHYVGYSYGTYLGVVYANLFPDNVGAMIVDGVLDPVAWSTGKGRQADFLPFSSRIKSAKGAQASLQEFFRTCDEGGIEQCAIAGTAQASYYQLLDTLRQGPIPIEEDGEVFYVDYAGAVSFTVSAMYDSFSWPYLAQLVADLDGLTSPQEAGRSFSALKYVLGEDEENEVFDFQPLVGFAGVACSDSDNPSWFENWAYAAEFDEARFGVAGPHWTWASSICHSWPGSRESRYEGDFKTQTANPVLVVSTLFDPATPYHGAKKVKRLLKKSRLVTVNGWGHGSIGNSECLDNLEADYLLNGTLPKKGAVCDQDWTPFAASRPLTEERNRIAPLLKQEKTSEQRAQLRDIRRKALREMRGK